MKLREKQRLIELALKEIRACDDDGGDDVILPIFQKILGKRIAKDASGNVIFEATVLQRVVGYSDKDEPLRYRVNGSIAEVGSVSVRRCVPLMMNSYFNQGEERLEQVGVIFTLDVRVPLEVQEVFNMFPFRILRACLSVELTSTSHPNKKNGSILRPSLWYFDQESGGSPTDVLQLKKGGDILDNRLRPWKFVDPNPQHACPREKKSDGTTYYPKTELTWFIAESGLKRLIPAMAAIYVVPLLAIANWKVHLNNMHWDQQNPQVDQSSYLTTGVGIAIAAFITSPSVLAVLELDQQAPCSWNDCLYLLWIVGLGCSCIPSEKCALGGISLLVAAGTLPVLSYLMYRRKQREYCSLVQETRFVAAHTSGKGKPRGSDFALEQWTPDQPCGNNG